MARDLQWSDLKIGVLTFAGIVASALSILIFARVGALHGDTTSIYVLTREAPGVLNGTDVWLSGAKIGQVKDIHFRPPSADTLERLALHLEILSDRMPYLRKDAYADIRPGGNLIGSPVVWISSGTSNSPALMPDDSLIDRPTGKMKPVGARVSEITDRMTVLADSGGRVLGLLRTQLGTVSNIVGTGIPRVAKAAGDFSDVVTRAGAGSGSVALIVNGDARERIAKIRAETDSITALLSTGSGNVGRFRSDSTLTRQIDHLNGELDNLKKTFSGSGGIARARSDTALSAEMARLRVELAALMADLKKHPRSYINF